MEQEDYYKVAAQAKKLYNEIQNARRELQGAEEEACGLKELLEKYDTNEDVDTKIRRQNLKAVLEALEQASDILKDARDAAEEIR